MLDKDHKIYYYIGIPDYNNPNNLKGTDMSSYSDLVTTLDEMQICAISKYAVVDLELGDKFLIENFINEEKFVEAIR